MSYGRRQLKGYPITEGELWALGGVGVAASVAFSLASGFVNFFVDTSKDLQLASGIAKETIAFWSALKFSALGGGVIFFLIGVALIVGGAFAIKRIIKRTTFDE